MLVQLSQNMLAKRLSYSDELQATVLEVKAIPGLGTTIDIVLLNGKLKEGQTMVVAGTEGPIVTTIRSLLTPSKMQDLRVKVSFVY
jgi:translation initiation factor 5B